MVLLNSRFPETEATQELARQLEQKYKVTVMAVDCLHLLEADIMDILHEMLYEFPVREVSIRVSEWID